MPRVKINFPDEKPLHIISIPIRISDLNYGNHVGNDAILSIMHEARVQWLNYAGFTEMNADGTGLIMADVMIAYKAESFYGDVLDIAIFPDEVADKSFSVLYRITTRRQGQELDIAHGKTGMVCFDYSLRKIRQIPDALRAFLNLKSP